MKAQFPPSILFNNSKMATMWALLQLHYVLVMRVDRLCSLYAANDELQDIVDCDQQCCEFLEAIHAMEIDLGLDAYEEQFRTIALEASMAPLLPPLPLVPEVMFDTYDDYEPSTATKVPDIPEGYDAYPEYKPTSAPCAMSLTTNTPSAESAHVVAVFAMQVLEPVSNPSEIAQNLELWSTVKPRVKRNDKCQACRKSRGQNGRAARGFVCKC